ncbi:MAG: hypothetical protein Ct9H90mP15_01780 [Candidatus Neomarinimicrobiota bacterium]|nr:MAG: hypothetical protein Ct9H90mP15_01780 [Candidatus Neomarinimicrobiota bacterium]
MKDPEKYGFKIPKAKSFKYDEVVIKKSADLSVIAKSAGTKTSTIKYLNPELRQSATPANEDYILRVPYGLKTSFIIHLMHSRDRKICYSKSRTSC